MMELIKEKVYPEAYTYEGKAYYSEVEFRLVRIPYASDWIANKLIESFESGIRKEGGVLLKQEVYEEVDTFTKTYYVRVWFYRPPALSPIVAVIVGCINLVLIVLGAWIVYKGIRVVKEVVWSTGKVIEEFGWAKYLIPISIGLFALGYVLRALPRGD